MVEFALDWFLEWQSAKVNGLVELVKECDPDLEW
jgi:hypothetical protein